MSGSTVRRTLGGLALAALFIALTVYASLGQRRFTCEVCITYKGHTKCRKAIGDERYETIRAATDNACAFLASGRTEIIQCGNVEPSRLECTER